MTISFISTVNCVLFDLDGTLIDTAPDMVNALNQALAEEGYAPLDYHDCRQHVSHGSKAMIEMGFGAQQAEKDFKRRRNRFLRLYENNMCEDTVLFAGMDSVLDYLENTDICWGIVTNKPEYLTLPLLEAMNLRSRACSVISGDTIAQCKPDPAPMRLALAQCGKLAENTVYIGDAQRDIQAGKNANIYTLLATYGYISTKDDIASWGADDNIQQAMDIIDKVKRFPMR